MPRKEAKARSARKALKDISNNHNTKLNMLTEFSSSAAVTKKMYSENKMEKRNGAVRDGEADCLDRLLLIQSDLSSLTRQIDQLVAQTSKLKISGTQGICEIEFFGHFLTDMISSLKPWVCRFQGPLSGNHMEEEQEEEEEENLVEQSSATKKSVPGVNHDHLEAATPHRTLMGSMISPSPLVSWRGSCRMERCRQLFLLTPLSVCRQPLLSKPIKSSAAGAEPPQCELASTPALKRREQSVLVMTPHLKMSPPKSCVVLEPNVGLRFKTDPRGRGAPKSTPFSVGLLHAFLGSSNSESSEDPRPTKQLDSSPDWSFSPPKTCVLLEPPKEKSKGCVALDHHFTIHSHSLDPPASLILPQKFNAQVESTPVWKEAASTFVQGKHPGENTLKKELWCRFEAASTCGLSLNIRAPDGQARRGFLDMLDEVSRDAKEEAL